MPDSCYHCGHYITHPRSDGRCEHCLQTLIFAADTLEAPWTEAPSYALIFINENTEDQGIVRQCDDVAILLAQRDIWNSQAAFHHYGVICQAPQVQAEHDAALLADIAALTGADIAAGF